MTDHEKKQGYQIPMTLEKHFKELCEQDGISIGELYSLHELLKRSLEEKLISSRSVFVNFSLHDASHARSIIHAIERFLGEERIRMLTPTDTFMLLICAYAHDYGMAQSYNKIYDNLGSKEFEAFLNTLGNDLYSLEKEDAQAVKNLLNYLNEAKTDLPINDMYWSIVLTMQLYLRSDHWQKVVDLGKDFCGLFEGHLKGRFVCGAEGITEICMCHGKEFNDIFHLSSLADGIIGDDFHPRFIAAMLRLGDLLDLDNNRFPVWFAREVATNRSLIPQLSILHYRKHEAVSHLLITDKKIAIRADCHSHQTGYETASTISQWTTLLQEECRNLRFHWDEIAPSDFGSPPAEPHIEIYIDGKRYRSTNKKMQMQMSQERVMKLFEGTNIYQDKYVGIREMIQNAVDASLFQLWEDITHNRYLKYGISKNDAKAGLKLTDFVVDSRNAIFANYDITVEVIKDLEKNQIILVVKDKGIGISLDDVEYIADIGSSKENNVRLRRLRENMPMWMKPSGIFGIGLQSVFQLTDCIEFYTRQPNQPERLISLYSYGKSKGKIDIQDVPPNEDGMFYDNTVPGTNVKIVINPNKMLNPEKSDKTPKHFLYYDTEFDCGEEIDIVFAEICQVCKNRIKSVKCDYFNILYQEIIHNKKGKDNKGSRIYPRRSYFLPDINPKGKKELPFTGFGETIKPLIESKGNPYCFIDNAAYYWDENLCRCYCLKIRPCEIGLKENEKQVFLPETTQNLYHISYKFNIISDTTTIYNPENRIRKYHAGFLEWNILILDDKPTRYMNIDRDHLRENAISEEEILKICGPILQKWCDYFCELDAKNPGKNRFEKTPGILLSLILLFYQNVSNQQFQRFINPYQEYLDSMNLVVGAEHIPITYFWDCKKLFQAEIAFPLKSIASTSDITDVETQKIKPETLRHFPHRLVQIESIDNSKEGKLLYRFCFDPTQKPHTIKMSDAARLIDYMQAFDPYTNRPEHVDFATIQKKIFKPDSKYPHLAIPCYPHTFNRGRNFSSHLDCCIQWYILSPFDLDTAKMLKEAINGNEAIVEELVDGIKKSVQFKKCVDYILKKRYGDAQEQEKNRHIIVNEYEEFIKNLFQSLYQNSLFVKEQFQKGRTMLT